MYQNDHGTMRVNTPIDIVDIWGVNRTRRINLGMLHGDLQYAKEMITKVRENNPNRVINGEFKITL